MMSDNSELIAWFRGGDDEHELRAADAIEQLQRERDEYRSKWMDCATRAMRLEEIIDDAEHAEECSGWCDSGPLIGQMIDQFCDCFKSVVLGKPVGDDT